MMSPITDATPDITALVCDDDRVTRSVVTEFIEGRGVRVIAETDGSYDAIELIKRFEPHIVVLDIGLRLGSGVEVIEYADAMSEPCQIVVFTAFADTVRGMEGRWVRIVEKPEFDALGDALDHAIRDIGAGAGVRERRRPVRAIEPPSMRQQGIDDAAEFYRHLAAATERDALVAFEVPGVDTPLVGPALRKAIRAQDMIALRPGLMVVLLIGGGEEGPPAVAARLSATHPAIAATARVFVLGAGDDPNDALDAIVHPH